MYFKLNWSVVEVLDRVLHRAFAMLGWNMYVLQILCVFSIFVIAKFIVGPFSDTKKRRFCKQVDAREFTMNWYYCHNRLCVAAMQWGRIKKWLVSRKTRASRVKWTETREKKELQDHFSEAVLSFFLCRCHSFWSELRRTFANKLWKNMQIALFCGKSLNFSEFLLFKRVFEQMYSKFSWLLFFCGFFSLFIHISTERGYSNSKQMMENTQWIYSHLRWKMYGKRWKKSEATRG